MGCLVTRMFSDWDVYCLVMGCLVMGRFVMGCLVMGCFVRGPQKHMIWIRPEAPNSEPA